MRAGRNPLAHSVRVRAAGGFLPLLFALSGCATYTDRVAQANVAVSAGAYADGLTAMNGLLGVSSADQLPDKWSGDRSLNVLERGVLQQSLGRYKGSARDFSAAEQELELLDLRADAIGALGSYLYSDSVKTYRTPPTERLALNAINLLNYLADGDLEGAAVEARRFQVMREFLDTQGIDASGPATLGTYLAGFVFERRGEGDRALRYYDETLAGGALESLVAPVTRLAAVNPYRGEHVKEIVARAAPSPKKNAPPPTELLVVLSLGRVPHKVPERIPVGAAVGIAGTVLSGDTDFLKYGATKVVVYPNLVSTPSSLGPPLVRVDSQDVQLEQVTDLGAAVRREYDEAKPKILAAALTRVAARAAVSEGVRAGGSAESKLLGDVLSIAVESVMVALDKPDTRSWTTLPERVLVARVPVDPGSHTVDVSFEGTANAGRVQTVEVPSQGYAAVVVTEPR